MFASTFRINAPEDGFDYDMVAIWTKLFDGTDVLHVIDHDVAADGPMSVTVGHGWDFKDLDIALRTDVANYFHDFQDPKRRSCTRTCTTPSHTRRWTTATGRGPGSERPNQSECPSRKGTSGGVPFLLGI